MNVFGILCAIGALMGAVLWVAFKVVNLEDFKSDRTLADEYELQHDTLRQAQMLASMSGRRSSVFQPGDTAPTDIDAALMRAEIGGATMTEAMEQQGLLQPSDEVSAKPWEV